MSEHLAIIQWQGPGPDFLKGKYSREHTWSFDGGATVAASASPVNVLGPWTNPAAVDPEEAYVAAIASWHMLWFLFIAGRRGFQVTNYRDEAVGAMAKNEKGVQWVCTVTLNPNISSTGERRPTAAEVTDLHHEAHEQCFIANSIKTEVIVAPAE